MWNNIKNSVILGIFSLYLAVGSCDWQDVSEHPNLSLLPNDICGQVNSSARNVNVFLKRPWMAVIRGDNAKGKVCGGTVINERYVLTAAQCVEPDTDYNVKLGFDDCEYRIENGIWKRICAPNQKIAVEQTIIHENFSSWHNDIALLRLSRKADLSSGAVKPICLPIAVSQQKADITGRTAEIAGWGRTRRDRAETRKMLESTAIIQECDGNDSSLADHPICAVSNGNGFCWEDAGGSLSLEEGDGQDGMKTVQYGIAIENSVRGSAGTKLYTRVGLYIKWILDNIKP